uniref:RING-type domain-containing protein n=1 Tax=Salvator merianae TaxID=96440 RepID=A0A8D0BLV9_SALMN
YLFPFLSQPIPEGLRSPDAPCPPKGPAPDLECSICFNLYNHSRLPKLLACQHVFCAICLKLILQRRSDAWTIVCPVCRTATAVFGGLISHLPNKEDVLLGSLTCPGSQMEAPFSLVTLPEKQVPGVCFDVGQDYDNSHNRVAAKRLMFLLLFLMLAVAIVLPFLHPGLLKWALCTVVGCGLAMVGVLCYNPQWKCSTSSLSFLSCRKGPLSPDHSQT